VKLHHRESYAAELARRTAAAPDISEREAAEKARNPSAQEAAGKAEQQRAEFWSVGR
jgi:hypothetical protein